jgi:hypothetical protein
MGDKRLAVKRPYTSLSVEDMRRLVEREATTEILDAVEAELQHRTTKAAKKLGEDITDLRHHFSKRPSPAPLSKQGAPAPNSTNVSAATRKPTNAQSVKRRPKTKSPEHPPTEEQAAAVSAFMTGGSLKISAFAGAGKTSTLQLMANERQGRGLYLAFNKKIADEARGKFPGDVDCRTTHSLASRAVMSRHGYSQSKMYTAIRAPQLASTLGLQKVRLGGVLTLTGIQQAYLFQSIIRRFCQSADLSIGIQHLPQSGRLLGLEPELREEIGQWAVERARGLWDRMLNASDEVPLGHDGYLKQWSVELPVLDYDYILLDEAQDTNPVVLAVLTEQKCPVSATVRQVEVFH